MCDNLFTERYLPLLTPSPTDGRRSNQAERIDDKNNRNHPIQRWDSGWQRQDTGCHTGNQRCPQSAGNTADRGSQGVDVFDQPCARANRALCGAGTGLARGCCAGRNHRTCGATNRAGLGGRRFHPAGESRSKKSLRSGHQQGTPTSRRISSRHWRSDSADHGLSHEKTATPRRNARALQSNRFSCSSQHHVIQTVRSFDTYAIANQ